MAAGVSRKPRRGDVIEVMWLDSERISVGWAATGRYIEAGSEPQAYRTAGYFIGKPKRHVLIALSVDPRNQLITDVMSIPKVAITQTRVLGRATRRVRKALA